MTGIPSILLQFEVKGHPLPTITRSPKSGFFCSHFHEELAHVFQECIVLNAVL